MDQYRDIMTIKWPDNLPETWGTITAWVVAGICILMICLLLTFPYGMLQARLVAELTRATGMEVRVADWSMGMPLSLEWRNVTLSKPNLTPIEMAVLQAKLGVLKALGGTLGLDVVVQLDATSSRTSLAKGTLTASSFSLWTDDHQRTTSASRPLENPPSICHQRDLEWRFLASGRDRTAHHLYGR